MEWMCSVGLFVLMIVVAMSYLKKIWFFRDSNGNFDDYIAGRVQNEKHK